MVTPKLTHNAPGYIWSEALPEQENIAEGDRWMPYATMRYGAGCVRGVQVNSHGIHGCGRATRIVR